MFGAATIAFMTIACIVGPHLVPYTDTYIDIRSRFAPPLSGPHILGTDPLGRDILARLLMAGRISMAVGFAAMMFATQFSAIQSTVPSGLELLIITAAVVGGVSILGGTGTVIGSTLGALLIHVIPNAMIFANISQYWQQAVQGVLILFTVLVDLYRRRRQTYGKK